VWTGLSQYLDTVLFHDGEQLERHPARALVAGFPLLDRRCAGVQVPGKDRLADVAALTDFLDLRRLDFVRHLGNAGLIEFAHGGLVDSADGQQCAGRAVNRLERFTFEFFRHCRSPRIPSASAEV